MSKQYDEEVEKEVARFLDGIEKKHGTKEARHAATKWARDKLELQKIEQEKAELEARLKQLRAANSA